jgi:exosortase A-associated hydrolase 2
MHEIPFYFSNKDYKLFGVFHKPQNINLNHGFVFCYPFEEEKLWVQRVFVNLARELCLRGYSVLRFDFMGEGDSEGDFEDSDINTRLSDITCALSTIKAQNPELEEIGLLGLRFGATLAALAAEKHSEVNKLIMWDPIVNGLDYLNEELRKNLTTQAAVYKKIIANRETLIADMQSGKTINIDGYELAASLYNQASNINLLDGEKLFRGKGLILQISRRPDVFDEKYMKLQTLYQNMELRISSEFPFWKETKVYYSRAENLYKDTIGWLEENAN